MKVNGGQHNHHHFDLWWFCGFWREQVPQRGEADREGGDLVAAGGDIAAINISVESNYNGDWNYDIYDRDDAVT